MKLFNVPLAALLAACVSSVPAFAQGTIKVSRSMELAAGAAKTWSTVKDFGGMHTWHPAVEKTEIKRGADNKIGAVRVLSLKGGGEITETLTAYSAPARSMTYRIDKGPLPVTGYNSTLAVKPGKAGVSTVTWSSTFAAKAGTKDEEAKKVIEGIYDTGLDSLKRKLGA